MKTYSQFEEDLFLLDFFKKKDTKDNFFFEFGAWDGVYLSNCRLLFENNWSGCFIELDNNKFSELSKNYKDDKKILLINEKINYRTKNINDLMKNCELLLVATPWETFKKINLDKFKNIKAIIDPYNLINFSLSRKKIKHIGMGN